MGQAFKAIYIPNDSKSRSSSSLTLAFSETEADLYKRIKLLSSHEIRNIVGISSYVDLQKSATKKGLPLNAYVLHRLRRGLANLTDTPANDEFIDPIHTTFVGGKKDPLHKWFPYLEGYSPQFVSAVIEKYAPSAQIIYDPFGGTGTTPLVSSNLGLTAMYSEVNPLLQLVTDVKVKARSLQGKQKGIVLTNLGRLKENFGKILASSEPDPLLRDAFQNVFGKSRFFDDETFELVLKARTVLDDLFATSSLSGEFAQVAVISSLVPSSLLQRAGDLRFKTQKELLNRSDFVQSVTGYLDLICSDLQQVEPLPLNPSLICEDAKDLHKLPNLKIDTVITSPPYLNGTNYFRNTKVELWFLRSLTQQSDLSGFRTRAVTAGINDVSSSKLDRLVPESVTKLVETLELTAYDKRIPRMVRLYCQDMTKVFAGLTKHLMPNSRIAIDIGDSIYNGTHVPTDELLVDCLKSIGYSFQETVILRKRTSRSGTTLSQKLLIFEWLNKPVSLRKNTTSWTEKWSTFKADQPHKELPFSKRNWGHPLHSLCSYQGKMKPSLANALVTSFCSKGDVILDPFGGVGTIPFEAALNGITAHAFDISPAAYYISVAKSGHANEQEAEETLLRLEDFIRNNLLNPAELEIASSFGYNRTLSEYYEPQTFKEILLARRYFNENRPKTVSEALVLSSLLHILHGNRPYALSRRSHGITPFAPTGEYEYRALMPRLRTKVLRSLHTELPAHFSPGQTYFQDATSWWPRHINDLDAIITSPPFFDSTRFHLANWIRLWFCGWDATDFKTKPLAFIDERQKMDMTIYDPILRQSRERLKAGGVLVLHLGNSRKMNMAEEIAKLSKRWFTVADIYSESVRDGESHGIRDKGTVTEHQYLVLS